MRRPRAYIAGPITSSGSLHENLHKGIAIGEIVRRQLGIHPFIPHLYDFTKVVTGDDVNWEDMLEMDENWITACDVLIALPGDSKGKEREIRFAEARHIPVIRLSSDAGKYLPYHDFQLISKWVKEWTENLKRIHTLSYT